MAVGSIAIDLLMRTGAFETDLKKAEKRWNDFTRNIKKGAAAVGLAFSVSKMIDLADDYTQMAARIRNATESLEEYEFVQNRLERSAKITYRALSEAQEGYLSFATTMKALGYATQDTLDLTDSLSFSFAANATQSDKAQAAQNALMKAMAKGRVDANAWITILTATDSIAGQVAASMGVTEAEVRKLGASGQLALADLIRGFIEFKDVNQDLTEKMSASFKDGLTNLTTSLSVYLGKLNDAYGATDKLAGFLVAVGDNIGNLFNLAALGGLTLAVVNLGKLGVTASSASLALGKLFALISAHPLVALAVAIAGVVMAFGEFQNAMDTLGMVAGDILSGVADLWGGLIDLVVDGYGYMVDVADDALGTQQGLFGGFFDDVGDGFLGFAEGVGKVFDYMAVVVNTTIDVMATNLRNFFVNGYNQLNDLMNGMRRFFGLAPLAGKALGDSDWSAKMAEQLAVQEMVGLQAYFKGLRDRRDAQQAEFAGARALSDFNSASGAGKGGGRGNKEQERLLKNYERALQDVENQLTSLANKALDWDQYGFDNQYTALRAFNQELRDANGRYAEFSGEQIRVLAAGFAQIDLKREALNIQELGLSYQKTFEDMRFEASLLGETTTAIERLRFARQLDNQVRELSAGMSAQGIEQLYAERDAILANHEEIVKLQAALSQNWQAGVKDGLNDFVQSAGTLRSQFASATTGVFDSLGNAIGHFVATGKASFKDLAASIFADLAKIALRMAALNLISSMAFSFGAPQVSAASGMTVSSGYSSVGGNMGLYGGFSEGGYTGPGGKHEVAGVVHKGEAVWSQADIKRHGGIEKVEALRLRGYADGGVVGQRLALNEAAGGKRVEVTQIFNIESGAQIDEVMLAALKKEMMAVSKAVYGQETTRQMMDGGVFRRGG